MEISRGYFTSDSTKTPYIKITNEKSLGDIILIHGYGGNKEEILGAGYRLSEAGFNTYSIDLKGHGENSSPLDRPVLEVINSIISGLPSKIKIAVGHSLGGRLALLSNANIRIGVSPALSKEYSEQTKGFIKNLRQYRVREVDTDINFTLLQEFPEYVLNDNDLVVYGSRDVPEIIRYVKAMGNNSQNIKLINNALHSDIFLLEDTLKEIICFITDKTESLYQ